MANKYSKALKHLKNKTIDEKLELLSEIPVNHTGGLYTDVPGVNEPETTAPGDLPLDQGLDLTEDGDGAEGYTGNDTTGLFLTDGTIKSVEPPGDTSYILGPMMSMWYAWANYTQIGYVRQADRKMVNLGRITGEMSDWDGETGFTGYGQLSIEQAVWFKEQTRADYRAFYPGPPSNPADEYGRYLGSMISTSKSTTRTVPGYWAPGTQRGFNATDDLALLLKNKEIADKNRVDEITRMALNAAMLGLDIVAVLAVLFPEPSSSAAGAVHLATKFRYAAKLTRALSRLNPFKRSPKPKITYRNRPTKARYGDSPKSKPTPKQLKYDPKQPGGGKEYQAAARNFQRQNPGKYNPYRSDSVNKLMKKYDVGTKPNQNPKYGKPTKFNNSYEYDTNITLLEQINKFMLFETAATGSDFGGGTEIADTYVDKVSETSSPEELEKASNDANDIAKESGQGLSDADLAKIDQDAAAEARRVTNIRISDPESMDGDQLFDALSLMYDADEEITDQLMDQYESLLDIVALDEAYKNFREREEYLSSMEYDRSVSSEYARQYDISKNLWDNYFSRGFDHRYAVFTRDNVPYWWNGRTPEEGQTFTVSSLVWDDTGKEFSSSEYQKVRQWSAAGKRRDDLYMSEVYPEKKRQRDLNRAEYKTLSNSIFRPYIIAMIRGWNEMYGGDDNINDDPYSLKGITPGEIANMSETEKRKLKQTLAKMGISYGDIAFAAEGGGLTDPLIDLVIGGGLAALGAIGTLYNMSNDAVQNLYQAATTLDSADYDNPYTRERDEVARKQKKEADRKGDAREKGTSEAEKQEKAEAAQQLQDAEAEIKDAQASGNEDRIDRAYDNYTKAHRNSARVGQKWRTNRKNQKESYEPRFLKNRERKNLTETRTPKQKKILREIKQPIKVKEAPTKYKMNFEGKYSAQNTPDKTASAQSDALVASGNAKGQKWKQQDKYWSGYETTERMNIIHDRVGHGKQAWDMILDEAKEKNGWRTREMQEELNKIAHERAMLKENPDYTSPFGNVEVSTTEKNLQNFEKVNKIKKVVSDKKVFSNKEIKPEYPEDDNKDREGRAMRMIQQMDQQKEYAGSKAQTGENAAARYKRLDPISANSMPDAGYPQIDQLRDQARKKPK